MALLRSQAKPFDSLRFVLRHALPGRKHFAKLVLGLSISLFRFLN